MIFAGKALNEYLIASKKYLAIIFFLTLITVLLRNFYDYSSIIQTTILLIGLIVLGLAGWATARKFQFTLPQIGFIGFILSFGAHWSLPLFHSIGEVLYLFAINSIINIVIVIASGFLSKKIKKLSCIQKNKPSSILEVKLSQTKGRIQQKLSIGSIDWKVMRHFCL